MFAQAIRRAVCHSPWGALARGARIPLRSLFYRGSTSMPLAISRIVSALEPSATLAMAAKAKELKAAGKTVYDFSVGEPDFTTPEHICQAAVAAMKAGHTHYTVASGIPDLRAAVAKQYEAAHRLKYGANQVVISNGAKHSLHNVFTALCNPGRRGDHSGPVLGELCRTGQADRRGAGDRADQRGRQLQALADPVARGNYAENHNAAHLFAVEPDRHDVHARGAGGASRRGDRARSDGHLDEIYERLIYGNHRFASFATVRPGMQIARSSSTARAKPTP